MFGLGSNDLRLMFQYRNIYHSACSGSVAGAWVWWGIGAETTLCGIVIFFIAVGSAGDRGHGRRDNVSAYLYVILVMYTIHQSLCFLTIECEMHVSMQASKHSAKSECRGRCRIQENEIWALGFPPLPGREKALMARVCI